LPAAVTCVSQLLLSIASIVFSRRRSQFLFPHTAGDKASSTITAI
jgi:hypothetical protein